MPVRVDVQSADPERGENADLRRFFAVRPEEGDAAEAEEGLQLVGRFDLLKLGAAAVGKELELVVVRREGAPPPKVACIWSSWKKR